MKEIITVAAVAGIFVLLYLGHRSSRASDEQKLEVLRQLNGKRVTLGIARGGQVWLGFPHTGKLIVGESKWSVTLIESKQRLVPLGQILWVVDVDTGVRLGGRSWAG